MEFRYAKPSTGEETTPKYPDVLSVVILTMSVLIITLCKDVLCEQSRRLVGIPRCVFTFDKNEVFIRKATINGSIPKLVPTSLSSSLLQQAHHSTFQGHCGERRMYQSLQRDYYSSQMVPGVYKTLQNCSQCLRMGTNSSIGASWSPVHCLDIQNSLPPIYLSRY